MKLLDIGEVARRSGVPPSTLRFYEEAGLIRCSGRRGLRRQYEPETLLQLSLIALGKSAGFPLADIARMFGRDGAFDLSRETLRTRATEVDRQIRKLTALKKALDHAVECPAPSHLECPTFQRLLKMAPRLKDKAEG
jgi:DNA-binding transcriptional MerR regulator